MTAPVLFIAGSLRAGSHTTALLRYAASLLPDDLCAEFANDIRELPHYDADQDNDHVAASVRDARERVAGSAAVVIATPEYNGTVPGGLKDWVDWITRPYGHHVLIGKPVAVLGGSPGSGGAAKPVAWLRGTLGALGAIVVGEPVNVADIATKIGDGDLEPHTASQLQALIDALVGCVTRPIPE